MSDLTPKTKRRKVRKGTQSCWECRRRKVRCISSAVMHSVCDNCTRRKTPCVSQELSEPPSLHSLPANEQLDLRLNRVEELIGQLSNPRGSGQVELNDPRPRSFGNGSDVTASVSSGEGTSELNATRSFASEDQSHAWRTADGFRELNRQMIAAWPSRTEIGLICALPVGLSSHLHCGVCRPYSSYEKDTQSTTDLLRLPPNVTHPVLFARKLLVLGTFLQGVLPSAVKAMEDQGFFPRQVMHRVVDIAIKAVTTRDELLHSVEAIECIMLEAMYHNYSGNLHRSWMATRRAITVAQSMALHRGFTSPSVKVLEPRARKEFDIGHLTFRLAEMDGYLSVMLGLQPSSLETRHITCEKALAACGPIERMQRVHYIVQERIIARSSSDDFDLAKTQEIDKVLRKAAEEMSPRWWLTPTFTPDHADNTKVMRDMTRIMDQFSHYHLLIRLHLPYVLSPDRRHDYSKVVAVDTSRELLNRFLSFRVSNPAHYYCRGSDFLAFIAATILCVVHIKSSEYAFDKDPGEFSDTTGFEFLAHNRLGDRGLMEQALEVIESIHERGTDAISVRISRILRDLFSIESNASGGKIYTVSSSKTSNQELECDGQLVDGGNTMRIHIPNFGRIDFVKRTITRTVHTPQENTIFSNATEPEATLVELPSLSAQELITSDIVDSSQQVHHNPFWGMSHDSHNQPEVDLPWIEADDWDLQGIDTALFNSLFGEPLQVEDHTDTSWTF